MGYRINIKEDGLFKSTSSAVASTSKLLKVTFGALADEAMHFASMRKEDHKPELIESKASSIIGVKEVQVGFYSDMQKLTEAEEALKLPDGHKAMCDALLGM